MNTLELKGTLHEMLAGVTDHEMLLKLKDAFVGIIKPDQKKEIDWWDELTAEQQTQLKRSIEETKRGENLIPHEQVMQEIEEKFKSIVK